MRPHRCCTLSIRHSDLPVVSTNEARSWMPYHPRTVSRRGRRPRSQSQYAEALRVEPRELLGHMRGIDGYFQESYIVQRREGRLALSTLYTNCPCLFGSGAQCVFLQNVKDVDWLRLCSPQLRYNRAFDAGAASFASCTGCPWHA